MLIFVVIYNYIWRSLDGLGFWIRSGFVGCDNLSVTDSYVLSLFGLNLFIGISSSAGIDVLTAVELFVGYLLYIGYIERCQTQMLTKVKWTLVIGVWRAN